MSAQTNIQWTDRSWNPVRGCTRVSPGCVNCYAETMAHRFAGPRKPYEGLVHMVGDRPQWTGKIKLVEDALTEPLSWRKPQRVFVNSMSDLFHDGVPDYFIARVFAVMESAHRHTFQILTKRPERMRALLSHNDFPMYVRKQGYDWLGPKRYQERGPHWRSNVHLGVSVEDQQRADERIPLLLQTPAAVRFLSVEPLLGPVDLKRYIPRSDDANAMFLQMAGHDPIHWGIRSESNPGINWCIVGGESGPGARPCNFEWVRSIVRQCQTASVPVFVKQLGANPYTELRDANNPSYRGQMICSQKDRKGGDMEEWPEDLRIREFPNTRTE